MLSPLCRWGPKVPFGAGMVPVCMGLHCARQKPALAPPDLCSRLGLGTTGGSEALHDRRLGVGPGLALAPSLCGTIITRIYRTLNLCELKFDHLVLWQSWDLNPGVSDNPCTRVQSRGRELGAVEVEAGERASVAGSTTHSL